MICECPILPDLAELTVDRQEDRRETAVKSACFSDNTATDDTDAEMFTIKIFNGHLAVSRELAVFCDSDPDGACAFDRFYHTFSRILSRNFSRNIDADLRKQFAGEPFACANRDRSAV